MPIFDHTQDLTGSEQYRLTTLYPAPEFVKTANHERLYGEPERMQPHLYADQANRLYPLHTAPAVWMSTLFFMDKQASLNPTNASQIEQRLTAAADYFGIRPAVEQLKQAMRTTTAYAEASEPDSSFALVWEDNDGHKERHYPLRNAAEVKMAASWFEQYRDNFLFEDRQRIAEKIYEKAAQYEVALPNPELIEKTAGYGYCPTKDVLDMLTVRSTMTHRTHPRESTELRKLASLVQQNGLDVRDTATRLKLAEVVDQFDRVTHLNRMYGNELDRPEDVLFGITEKTASNFTQNHVQLVSGTIYKTADLHNLTVDGIRDWLGSDLADEVSDGLDVDTEKLATILATLPRGDAELFERMASTYGIRPYAHDKAAQATGLSLEEMQEVASLYRTA